jgi:hypothetical protein
MAETASDDQGRIGSVVVPGMDFGKGGLDGAFRSGWRVYLTESVTNRLRKLVSRPSG